MGNQISKIIWDENALWNFIDILNYIRIDSPSNAKIVSARVLDLIKNIRTNPMMYREDELKNNNDGTYRVFNRDSIRVSYKTEATVIIITRVKHSSQEPIKY